jgi:peroxiredoxin
VELPHAEALYRELKDQGFGLLTITQDSSSSVLPMVEYNGITHPIVSDTNNAATGKVYEKYHAYDGKHYVIGSDGTILAAFSKLGVSIPILKRELAKHGILTGAKK